MNKTRRIIAVFALLLFLLTLTSAPIAARDPGNGPEDQKIEMSMPALGDDDDDGMNIVLRSMLFSFLMYFQTWG